MRELLFILQSFKLCLKCVIPEIGGTTLLICMSYSRHSIKYVSNPKFKSV